MWNPKIKQMNTTKQISRIENRLVGYQRGERIGEKQDGAWIEKYKCIKTDRLQGCVVQHREI